MRLEQTMAVLKNLYRSDVLDACTFKLILYSLVDKEIQLLDEQKQRVADREAAARADGTLDDQVLF